MARIVITIEDDEGGEVVVTTHFEPDIARNPKAWSLAQRFSQRLMAYIAKHAESGDRLSVEGRSADGSTHTIEWEQP